MSMEFIAIISVGATMLGVAAALAGLIITGHNGLRTEMREQREEMQEQGIRLEKKMQEQRKEMQEQGIRLEKELKEQRKEMQEQGIRLEKELKEQRKEMQEQGIRLSKEIKEQGKEIEGVKLEVAALKATVDTCFRVRVDPPVQAAVADPPGDYGAD